MYILVVYVRLVFSQFPWLRFSFSLPSNSQRRPSLNAIVSLDLSSQNNRKRSSDTIQTQLQDPTLAVLHSALLPYTQQVKQDPIPKEAVSKKQRSTGWHWRLVPNTFSAHPVVFTILRSVLDLKTETISAAQDAEYILFIQEAQRINQSPHGPRKVILWGKAPQTLS